jgi:hypothetical protein
MGSQGFCHEIVVLPIVKYNWKYLLKREGKKSLDKEEKISRVAVAKPITIKLPERKLL